MDYPNWKILLIDDDQDDYVLTREILKQVPRRRIHLDYVPSIIEGREKVLQNCYDTVLIDYDLGAYTGLSLIREMKTLGVHTPMIMLTGHGSYEVDLEAMEAGASDYLSKKEISPALIERSIRYAIETERTNQAQEDSRTRLALLMQISEQLLSVDNADDLLKLVVDFSLPVGGCRNWRRGAGHQRSC